MGCLEYDEPGEPFRLIAKRGASGILRGRDSRHGRGGTGQDASLIGRRAAFYPWGALKLKGGPHRRDDNQHAKRFEEHKHPHLRSR